MAHALHSSWRMNRSERQILLATFLFGVLGMVGIGFAATRYADHPQALPPLELPYFEPPPLPHFEPLPPVAAPAPGPRHVGHGHGSATKPKPGVPIKDCADDPLCGLGGLGN